MPHFFNFQLTTQLTRLFRCLAVGTQSTFGTQYDIIVIFRAAWFHLIVYQILMLQELLDLLNVRTW